MRREGKGFCDSASGLIPANRIARLTNFEEWPEANGRMSLTLMTSRRDVHGGAFWRCAALAMGDGDGDGAALAMYMYTSPRKSAGGILPLDDQCHVTTPSNS